MHGLWLTGIEGGLLRRRLAKDLGAVTHSFSYPSVNAGIAANAQSLARFLERVHVDTLHLVGHSLGGLVILKMFEHGDAARLPPGRIVLLGSPLQGSRTARNVAGLPFGRKILGLGAHEELLATRERCWAGRRDLGIIAGNLSVGMGRLVGRHREPSDGTVFVGETLLPGAAQHLVLRVSHAALPFSSGVARHTAAFLRSGAF